MTGPDATDRHCDFVTEQAAVRPISRHPPAIPCLLGTDASGTSFRSTTVLPDSEKDNFKALNGRGDSTVALQTVPCALTFSPKSCSNSFPFIVPVYTATRFVSRRAKRCGA